MLIRGYGKADRDGLIALWEAAGLVRPWNPPDRDIAISQSSSEADLFIGEVDGRLAGSVMVGHDGHRGWVYYLAVATEYAGQGHGRALMRHAEAWLAGRGIPRILLMIRPANDRVQDFYESLGYMDEKVVLMGRWLDEDTHYRPVEGDADGD